MTDAAQTLHLPRVLADHSRDMRDQVVAITGTTSGTGYVCAREVARLGATVLLLNKHDLTGDWDIAEQRIDKLRAAFGAVFLTSAKTGAEVEDALTQLANLIVDDALAARQ